jgi:lipopolysaccharide cholinephosphotransferase
MTRIPKDRAIKMAQDKCLELLLEFDQICKANQITYWLDGGTLLGAKRHGGFIPWDDDVDICLPIVDYMKVRELVAALCKTNPKRMLYYHGTEFISWHDYYGDTTLLTDGIFPVRIDLLPVKFIPNNEAAVRLDRSLTEIATLYMRGFLKNPDLILQEHRHWLPGKDDNLLERKKQFLNFYMEYAVEMSKSVRKNDSFLVNYIFNDAYVNRSRDYYKSSWIFPLVERNNFEKMTFPQPKDIDSYLNFLYGPNHNELPPENSRISHLVLLQENHSIPKEDLSGFIDSLYQARFLSYDIPAKMGFNKRTLLKTRRFVALTLSLILKGKVTLAYRFWRYNLIHALK